VKYVRSGEGEKERQEKKYEIESTEQWRNASTYSFTNLFFESTTLRQPWPP